jgi:hypothetical protein
MRGLGIFMQQVPRCSGFSHAQILVKEGTDFVRSAFFFRSDTAGSSRTFPSDEFMRAYQTDTPSEK